MKERDWPAPVNHVSQWVYAAGKWICSIMIGDELWGLHCEYFGCNRGCYNGTALHWSYHGYVPTLDIRHGLSILTNYITGEYGPKHHWIGPEGDGRRHYSDLPGMSGEYFVRSRQETERQRGSPNYKHLILYMLRIFVNLPSWTYKSLVQWNVKSTKR